MPSNSQPEQVQGAPVSQTSTTETRPFSEQIPFLRRLFQEAETRLGAKGPRFFPGQMTAGFAPETEAAQGALVGAAQGPLADLTRNIASSTDFVLGGDVLDPASNPYLTDTINAAIRPVEEALTERIIPGIRSSAVATGNLGTTRQGVAEGRAIGDFTRTAGDISSELAFGGYQSGLDALTRTLAVAPSLQGPLTAEATALDAVGQQKRALEQSRIDDAIARFNFNENLPDDKLAQFASLISGNFGGTTTGQVEGTGPSFFQPQGDTASQAAGLSLGGAALATTLFPAFAAAGPVGAGIGLLMALL